MSTFIGRHCEFKLGATTLGKIIDVTDLGGSEFETIDANYLGDIVKTFIKTEMDPGTISLVFELDLDETNYVSMVSELNSETLVTWSIVLGAITKTFSGSVVSLSRPAQKNKRLIAEAKIKVSGTPPL